MNLKKNSATVHSGTKTTFGPQISHSAITGHKGYELNNVFYVIIVELLNLISLINIIFKVKYLIELNEFYDIYAVLKNFYPICINLCLIIVFTILFLRYSLVSAKCENLATNSFQLGDDLVLINEENENFTVKFSQNSTTTTYFTASLTQSSASSEASISPTPSSTCEISPLDEQKAKRRSREKLNFCEKIKFYKKFYFLPANIVLHLITCVVILLTKMLLSMKLTEMQRKNSNATLTILNANNTIVVSTYSPNYINNNRDFQVFGYIELLNLFYSNQILINIDYFNYFFALLMFMINISRVYIKLNSFFAVVLIMNLFIYMIQNLMTILTIDYIFTLPSSSSRANSYENSNLAFIRIITTYVFDNKLFILVSYLASWILNLIYYTAFNIYCIFFYNKAHLKLITKYKCYLNRYYNFHVNVTPRATSSSSSSSAASSSSSSTSSTSSASSSLINEICLTGSHVFTQYKAIIFGIVILLLIEVLQIPYLYNCYTSYNTHVAYLIALLVQLVYLLLNAFIWIILTLKHKWKLNFTLKFQILLWHTLFYNYLNEYYGSVNSNIHTSTAKNEQVDVDNQNLQVKMLLMRKQQQIPKSFVNVIGIANDKLNTNNNSLDKNRLLIRDEDSCEDNNMVNNLSNDTRSDCGTASTLLSQQTTNFKARVINCNPTTQMTFPNKHNQVGQNPAIIKKIVQMNRNKKLMQADPRQLHQHQPQLRSDHTNSSSNLVTSWNEFIVNEND